MKNYKSYKEMTRCVLEARDEHLKKKRRKQLVIRRCIPVMSSFCFAVILGFGFWKNINKMPEIEPKPSIAEATTTELFTSEKESSNMCNTENNTTQKPTEQSTTQNVTSHDPSTGISQETSLETDNTEMASPTTNSEIIEAPTESYIEPTETATVSQSGSDTPTEPTTTDDDRSGCADNHIYLHWDEMTINQQYFMAEFGEPTLSYSTAEKEVSFNDVGEYTAKAYMSGYDWYESIYYHCEAEAYKIKDEDDMHYIAIKFVNDDKYYLYTLNVPKAEDQPSG